MNPTIEYILSFLLFGHTEWLPLVGYTANRAEWPKYRVVIVPGRNRLADASLPWCEPCLAETPRVEEHNGVKVVLDDLVYNTLYCISLAGEPLDAPLTAEVRDGHGRIASMMTALGRQGLQLRPVVDEYAALLVGLLGFSLPEPGFADVVLTHDVDTLTRHRHLRGALGGLCRMEWGTVMRSLKGVEHDPVFTFGSMHEMDSLVPGARQIYFLKAGDGRGFDYPQYALSGKDFRYLLSLLDAWGAEVGLHGSYSAAETLTFAAEKQRLEASVARRIQRHRNHYLRLLTFAQLQAWADAGIAHDYSLGWADALGFRLGTTRAVRWVNPVTMQLTPLTLHPLSVMDRTLVSPQYMHLTDGSEALRHCVALMKIIRQYRGELVLLWHNNSMAEAGFVPGLYHELLLAVTEML